MQVVEAEAVPVGLIEEWKLMPPERSHAFVGVFGDVVRAIQVELRSYLPQQYFQDPAHYREIRQSLSMIVYQCSPPTPRRQGREFTYDLLSIEVMKNLFWSLRYTLPAELRKLEDSRLLAEQPLLARMYSPRRYVEAIGLVQRKRTHLHRLLATETGIINALMLFITAMRQTRRPDVAHRRLMTAWRTKLYRVYPGLHLPEFAPRLLEIATDALKQSLTNASEFSGPVRTIPA